MPRVSFSLLIALALSAGIFGCSGESTNRPGLAAANSRTAQAELRRLEDEWEVRSNTARAELRPELEQFVEKHGSDPSASRARIMLAQIALFERRLGSAEEILGPVVRGPEGRTRDEAEVILAAIDNRRGRPEAALERLQPLLGKLLTREARDQYARERTSAAIAARRWRLTVDAMTDWLAEAGADSRPVQEWIEAAIVQVPTRALSRLLSDWKTESSSPADEAAAKWVRRVVIEHLSREALRSRDPLLARDLLERAPPWLRAGENGDELAVLAALAQKDARVVGRGVGVVLGGKTELERRRSVRMALGLIRGLDLGRGEGTPDGIQILAVENRGSMNSALGTLTGLGASILVAGVDQQGAQEALLFSSTQRVPVITMADPEVRAQSSYGFVFGESVASQRRAVESSRKGSWAVVGDDGISCSRQGSRPTTTTLPLLDWKESGMNSVLVLGDAPCCRGVGDQLRRAGWEARLVCGLESAHVQTSALSAERLSAGAFPGAIAPKGDRVSEQEKQLERGAIAPALQASDWFFTLGLDAAKLVKAALGQLPETQVTEREAVRKRHERAAEELRRARADLLTTEARGFDDQGRIARTLVVNGPADQ